MSAERENIAILICARKANVSRVVQGSVEETCAECGETVLRKPDPDVPTDAIIVCMQCGVKMMSDSDEVPEIHITKQNVEHLAKHGYKLDYEGSC